jgi:hypothetical protein
MAIDFNLLTPSVVTGLVSRLFRQGNVMQRFFGFEIGGPNVTQVSGRSHSWDIYDRTRIPAKGRAPGTGPGTRAANPVGRQVATIARAYEKVGDISYEKLNNIRVLGENAGSRDKLGIQYLENQAITVRDYHDNFREFLTWGMVQGSCGFSISGDDWIPVLSSPDITIDYKMPSGNKSQLNMLGAGDIISATWATAGTDIPTHLDKINTAFMQLVGAPLAFVITDSTVWRTVLKNTQVQNQAGSVNTAYIDFEQTEDRNSNGQLTGLRRARIKAYPWLEWIIWDGTLNINGTETGLFGGTKACFGIRPDKSFCQMVEGSEPVKESPWAPAVERFGSHFWLREWDEPARVELHGISNCLPEMRIPKGLAFGTVIF